MLAACSALGETASTALGACLNSCSTLPAAVVLSIDGITAGATALAAGATLPVNPSATPLANPANPPPVGVRIDAAVVVIGYFSTSRCNTSLMRAMRSGPSNALPAAS